MAVTNPLPITLRIQMLERSKNITIISQGCLDWQPRNAIVFAGPRMAHRNTRV